MNTPGASLFQGAESIQLNASVERAEEAEALEDQRRRNEELGNLLLNAFDDLEDDETTLDSIGHTHGDLAEHEPPPELPAPPPPPPTAAQDVEVHQLKMLVQSRSNEVENVQRMANEEHKRREECQKRLLIAEAELNRALAAKQNTHELLVESKERCSNLEDTIESLRSEKKCLEAENNAILGKLETAQMLLSDVQQKYEMVERDLSRQNNRNAETRLKQAEERHRAEIEMQNQQIAQLAAKLERRTSELEQMTTRYKALTNSHELMLVDKGAKINDLNHALNEAQKKCEELLSRPDHFQDNLRLQKLIASLQTQIEGQEKTIGTLRERLDFTTAELDVMDSLLHQHNLEDTPNRRLSQTTGAVVGSTPINPNDRVGHLKDELFRALANLKSKRDDIRKLQQTLDERTGELRAMREEENKSLVKISLLQEEKQRLENRVQVLQSELEPLAKDAQRTKALDVEAKELRAAKAEWEAKCAALEAERQRCEGERQKLDGELKNAAVDLEELKQEHESMKRNYEQILKENKSLRKGTTNADGVRLELEKHKFLLKDAQAECDRLKNLYVDIANAKESLAYEVEQLRKADAVQELQGERAKVASLQRAQELAEVKSAELAKILETEKLCHQREVVELREKLEKAKHAGAKVLKDTSDNCSKCLDLMADVTKLEIQNLKLATANSTQKKELDALAAELEAAKAAVEELQSKLTLSGEQEGLIKDLKDKAAQFEEYIKTHSSASEKSSPSGASKSGANTSHDLERAEVKRIETRIREEMAKIFAAELKRVQVRLQQTEEKARCLQREYEHVMLELQQRQTEVELLKQAILAEREKMEEILNERRTTAEEAVQRHKVMLRKCRDDLKAKTARIGELAKELAERQQQIEAERKSMKAVMSQWELQRQNMDTVEEAWRQKVKDLQAEYRKDVEMREAKLKSAKRTAANYQRYAEEKEVHMNKEYELLKLKFDSSLAKVEELMHETLQRKDKQLREAWAAIGKRQASDGDKENRPRN